MAARYLILGALAALLAGCGALVDHRADEREAIAEARYPPTGRLLEIDGVTVHADIEGAGPDLVLLHGASGNTRDFTFDLVGRLKDRYRVIAFDRPGLGWTDRLPGHGGVFSTRGESPMAQAALLQKAADKLGVEDPVVLGHSYGGAVAMAWGLARPRRTAALVILSGATEPWPGSLGAYYKINGSSLGGATLVPLITAFAPPETVRETVAAIFAPQKPPAGYVDYVGTGLSLRRESLRANAQQVSGLRPHLVAMSKVYDRLPMPVEIVHGTADDIVPIEVHAEVLARQVPGANLTRLQGVGHMPHHARPEAVTAAIDRASARAGH